MFLLKVLIWIEALIVSILPHRTVVIDTETTGTTPSSDEVLQVSIVGRYGRVLFNHYIKPTNTKRWPEAQKINHISPLRVKACPNISVYAPLIAAILKRTKTIIGYNTEFDLDFLQNAGINIGKASIIDVMREDAERRNGAKWRKLIKTAANYGYFFVPHSALEDCKATLHVYNRMFHRTDLMNYLLNFAVKFLHLFSGIAFMGAVHYYQLPDYLMFMILAVFSLAYGAICGSILGFVTAVLILQSGTVDIILMTGIGLVLGLGYKILGITNFVSLRMLLTAVVTFSCLYACFTIKRYISSDSVLSIITNRMIIELTLTSPLYLAMKDVLVRII